jgi:prepilin-type processing-associated H-X9-DG protein
MLLPALSRAKQKAHGIMCLNNGRQMTLAWRLYVEDNGDKVPRSYDPGSTMEWVHGSLNFDGANRSNWDVEQDLEKSLLWDYCGATAEIWKCPADRSTVSVGGRTLPRVRSIAMNGWFDSTDVQFFGDNGYRIYKKMADVTDPGPTMTWLFIDEREDSINDGEMIVGMFGFPDQPSAWKIVDYPASYHGGAGGLSFVDGHSEIRKWEDARTTPALRKGVEIPLNVSSPANPDVLWMMERTTRKTI